MVRIVYETEQGKVRSQLLDERLQFDMWTHSEEKGVIVILGVHQGKCYEIIAKKILHIHIIPEVSNNE